VAKSSKGLIARLGDAEVPYHCALGAEAVLPWDVCASALSLDDPAKVLAPPARR
jgi:hypothetical protein